MQHRHELRELLGRKHLECGAVALCAAVRLAQVGAGSAFEVELGQAHARFLSDLQSRQSQVDIEGQALAARLIEDGLARVQVGQFPETPDELLGAGSGSDRIAERDPAAARDLVHHESVVGLAEQQPLVSCQGGVGDGQIGLRDDRAHTLQVLQPRYGGLRPRGPQEVEQHISRGEHDHGERGSQHPGGVGIERERPPEVFGIVDVSVGDEADPDGHGDHSYDAHDPYRSEALGKNGRRAVEGAPPEGQHAQHEDENARLLEIESLQDGDHDAGDEQPESDVIGRRYASEQGTREHQQPQADHAPGEVRDFQHRQRQEAVQDGQPRLDSRRRAR